MLFSLKMLVEDYMLILCMLPFGEIVPSIYPFHCFLGWQVLTSLGLFLIFDVPSGTEPVVMNKLHDQTR